MSTNAIVGRRDVRYLGPVLTAVIVELTVATAYIHLSLGGTLFLLNGLGYLALAAAYLIAAALPMPIVRRFSWLPRLGLGGYALLTIGAYLAMGPYFALGWIAKGIEVAIVGLVVVDLLSVYGSPIGLVRAAVASVAMRVVVLLVAVAAVVAACSPASGGSEPSADATITSRDMAFSSTTITVPAGEPFILRLVNEDEVPHNVAIYVDSSATDPLFVGELITSATVVYEVPALGEGTYFFRCDLHPEMTGTLVAEG